MVNYYKGGDYLEELLEQIELALQSGLYMIALQSTLTLPDICGALEYPNQGVGKRYKAWYTYYYKEYVLGVELMEPCLTADECYLFRCSFVHQASNKNEKLKFDKIVFFDPTCGSSVHNVTGINGDEKILFISLETFCKSMVHSVRLWLNTALKKRLIKTEYDKLPKYHQEGIPPFFNNQPVIW